MSGATLLLKPQYHLGGSPKFSPEIRLGKQERIQDDFSRKFLADLIKPISFKDGEEDLKSVDIPATMHEDPMLVLSRVAIDSHVYHGKEEMRLEHALQAHARKNEYRRLHGLRPDSTNTLCNGTGYNALTLYRNGSKYISIREVEVITTRRKANGHGYELKYRGAALVTFTADPRNHLVTEDITFVHAKTGGGKTKKQSNCHRGSDYSCCQNFSEGRRRRQRQGSESLNWRSAD